MLAVLEITVHQDDLESQNLFKLKDLHNIHLEVLCLGKIESGLNAVNSQVFQLVSQYSKHDWSYQNSVDGKPIRKLLTKLKFWAHLLSIREDTISVFL